MPPKNESLSNDFGKNKLLKNISENVNKLSNDIRQPDKFAQIFCEAAKTQKNIDYILKEVIVDLLSKNSEAQQAITSIVAKVDRDYTRAFSGKVAWGIWTITIIVIEAILHAYFK